MQPTKPVLNTEVLRSLQQFAADDPDFVPGLVDAFLSSIPPIVEKLDEAARAKDPTQIAQLAHALASNAGNVGAEAMSEICYALIKLGKAGAMGNSAELIDLLGQVFDETKIRLNQFTRAR